MKLHNAQRHVLSSNKDKRAYIGGRVCGKTRLVAAAAIESAADWTTTDVVAPHHRMAMEIRDRVLDIIEKEDISYKTANKHIIELELGREIKFWNTQSPESTKGIESSPSVIVDEAQAIQDEKIEKVLERPQVLLAAQNHSRIHEIVDYESDEWEYAISPTTANPDLSGAMMEEHWFDKPEEMFLADYMIRLTDLSNGHTLALPSRAYPYWKVCCLDCDFSKTLDVRDGINGNVKKYTIGSALDKPCR